MRKTTWRAGNAGVPRFVIRPVPLSDGHTPKPENSHLLRGCSSVLRCGHSNVPTALNAGAIKQPPRRIAEPPVA